MTPPEEGNGRQGAGVGGPESGAPAPPPEITQAPVTAAVIGLVGGGLSALLGVGGGIVMVPAMAYLLRVRPHRAHGTSLAVMIPAAAAGVYRYARAGHLAGGLVLPLAVGAVLGALIGAAVGNALRSSGVKRLLGVLVIGIGFLMVTVRAAPGPVAASAGPGFGLALAVGLIAGAVSGLLGVGGGIVMVPAVVFLLGQDQHVAQGVSLAVIIPVSALGSLIHARHGTVIVTLAFWLAVGGVIGALIVGGAVQGFTPGVLRILFGIFLVIMGLTMTTRPASGRTTQPIH